VARKLSLHRIIFIFLHPAKRVHFLASNPMNEQQTSPEGAESIKQNLLRDGLDVLQQVPSYMRNEEFLWKIPFFVVFKAQFFDALNHLL